MVFVDSVQFMGLVAGDPEHQAAARALVATVAKPKKWAVRDWAGNRMFPDKTFATFEDGWEFVCGKFPDAHDEWEDIYVVEVEPGTWEDRFVAKGT